MFRLSDLRLRGHVHFVRSLRICALRVNLTSGSGHACFVNLISLLLLHLLIMLLGAQGGFVREIQRQRLRFFTRFRAARSLAFSSAWKALSSAAIRSLDSVSILALSSVV